jgi:hypothetical protein
LIGEADGAARTREPRYLAGFTAIGIIVLAAIAYSIRISLDTAAGSNLLTATFLFANIVGWTLGVSMRRREPDSLLGLVLVLLGDTIFPLNLYAPFLLFVPGMRGNIPMAATGVVVVGIVYHLWNYWNRRTARFALPFYPYFFVYAVSVGLVLTRFTVGLPMWIVAGLVLLFAIGFNELSYRRRPEPATHFAVASAALLGCSLIVSSISFRDRNMIAFAALLIGTLVLIGSAIRERGVEAMGRAHGLAAWIGVTLTFTAVLYYFQSPLWVYFVATGAWTIVLAILSTRPAEGWTEPFFESAWWAAMLLAISLAGILWKIWLPFIVRTLAARPLREAATVALLAVGLALLLVSVWRRRYPTIAATLPGFVTNNVLLRLTSYAAPLLLVIAMTGSWSMLPVLQPANVYALLAAGMLLLIAGPRFERHYPTEALDFAGVLAMVFSAFNGLASAMLSAFVLFAAALIFLARFVRGARAWTFAAFLVLTAGGLSLQTMGTPVATVIFLVAAAVVAWGSTRAAGAMARIGFGTAHAVAFLFWLSLARTLGLGRGYDAVIFATWAWFALTAWRLARGRAARQTSLQVCVVLIAASLVTLLTRPAATEVLLVSLLTLGALFLELRHVHYAGFALLAVAVIFAANRGDATWLVAVLAAAAAVLLWQSLARGSSFGHMLFIAAAAATAYLSMPDRGALQALPIAIVVTLFLLVELIALKLQASSSFHGDLTSVISLLLAVTILVAEVSSARLSIYVLAILLISMIAVRPWIRPSEGHRVQPMAHAAFRTIAIVTTAVVVVAAAHLAGLTAGQQLFALAVFGWIVLGWLLRQGRASAVAGAALHLIALGVYVSAAVIRGNDPFLLSACLAMAGAYIVWRVASKRILFEHFAAIGVIEVLCLWGLARRIEWPEYYLFAGAAYLCVVLLRQTAPRAQDVLSALLIAAAVAYPYYALLRGAQQEHLAFLGIASIVVIHVLLTARRHAFMIVAVCAMLGLGMLFAAVVIPGDVRTNLLMAIVGFLVIADLGVIGLRSDRRLMVGDRA